MSELNSLCSLGFSDSFPFKWFNTILWSGEKETENETEKRGKIVKSGQKSFSFNFYEGWTLNIYGVCLTKIQVPSGLWLVRVTHLFYSIHFTWQHIPFNYRITVCYFYDCRDHRPTNEQWTMSTEQDVPMHGNNQIQLFKFNFGKCKVAIKLFSLFFFLSGRAIWIIIMFFSMFCQIGFFFSERKTKLK